MEPIVLTAKPFTLAGVKYELPATYVWLAETNGVVVQHITNDPDLKLHVVGLWGKDCSGAELRGPDGTVYDKQVRAW